MLDSSLCFLENDKKTAQSAHSRHGLKMRPCGGIGRRAALKMQYLRMCPFESGQGHHHYFSSCDFTLLETTLIKSTTALRIAAFGSFEKAKLSWVFCISTSY